MKRKGLVVVFALCLLAVSLSVVFADDGSFVSPLRQAFIKGWYGGKLRGAGLESDQLQLYSIGQSHIDAAWRWRVSQTRVKCVRTFRRAIKHINKFPEFYYTQSSPQFFEWVMEDDPDLFRQILEAEKAGRFEIVGGMWVEPDCNMPDGESFVRHRLYGQRFYLEHFGHMSDVSWALDSFGYNWNMPQIMVKSGAKYMWTSKLTWNDTTVFPFHLFHWQSPDGTRILTHICPISPLPIWFPLGELGRFKSTRYLLKPGAEITADYTTSPEEIEAVMSDDFVGEFGIFYGLGDGGHGPLRPEIKNQLAFQKQGYGRLSTAREFFQSFDKYADRLPVWNEEMYLEYHRGVQTTQAWIKRANRMGEQLMQSAEAIGAAAMVFGHAYPQQEFTRTWKLLLLNHFHDILPGSSVPEVYDDARADHYMIQKRAQLMRDASLEFLATEIDTRLPDNGLTPVVVFNTLSWERTGIARVEVADQGSKGFRAFDDDMNEIPCQLDLSDGKVELCFLAEKVPPVGYRVYYIRETGPSAERGVKVGDVGAEVVLENESLRVKIDKKSGWLSSVYDKGLDREMLSGNGNELLAFRDQRGLFTYSAWNINKDYINNPLAMPPAARVEVDAEGPLFARVRIERKFNKTDIVQDVTLYKGEALVHMGMWFDFHEKDAMIKQGFDTTIKGEAVAADIPYAVIERPTYPKTPSEKARWEMPCQKWIDISDGQAGLALINNGKYGFSLNDDGTGYRLTIIRGAHYPKAMPLAHDVKQHLIIPTGITDQGEHRAWTALYPHEGDWREGRVWRAGYEFNCPLVALKAEPQKGPLPSSASLFSVNSNDVYIGSIKKAEDDDDLVIRLTEAVGSRQRVKVRVYDGWSITNAVETDLLEFNPHNLAFTSNSVSVELGPYEIKTIKVSLK